MKKPLGIILRNTNATLKGMRIRLEQNENKYL